MFRIRRIYDDTLTIDRKALDEVQQILRSQFSAVSESEIASLSQKLSNPLKYRFRTILFVADDMKLRVKGFALLNHAPNLSFCFLDFIAVDPKNSGRRNRRRALPACSRRGLRPRQCRHLHGVPARRPEDLPRFSRGEAKPGATQVL